MKTNEETLKADAERVAAYLREHHLGVEKATTNHHIARAFNFGDIGLAGRTGLENSRYVTQLLLVAREAGHPIVADHTGIFYARYAEDVVSGVTHMRRCAEKYERHAFALEVAAVGLPSRPAQVTA
jgi:hypothetical protein